MPGNANEVFDVISKRLGQSAKQISFFAKSGYSFEEWCNWEAFFACCEIPNWVVSPRPRYRDLGLNNCKDLGDLLVKTEQGTQVLVEVGLVHDQTTNKWLAKLDGDLAKLNRIAGREIQLLQIIILASAKESILTSSVWTSWLRRLQCWNRQTELLLVIPSSEQGQIIIKGWATC